VPNRQTKEYRGGGATALGILTSKPAVLLPGRQILVSTQKCGRSKNPFGRDDSERNPFACQKIMPQTTFLAVHNGNMELHQNGAVQTEGEVYYQKGAK